MVAAFQTPSTSITMTSSLRKDHLTLLASKMPSPEGLGLDDGGTLLATRRSAIVASASILLTAAAGINAAANAEDENMYAPKFVQTYEDFTMTTEGWSYKDIKVGSGRGGEIRDGDRVVFDWSGYTIGYFGRPFEAKGCVCLCVH